MEISCHRVSSGCASSEALVTKEAISFLGNVDPKTGMIVGPGHELHGKCIAGKVLIFPGGKGSTVGSYVIYQLKKRGLAPAAMINIRSEPIVAVGAIISGIPLVDRVPLEVLDWESGTCVTVDANRAVVVVEDPLREDGLESALLEKCKEDSLTEKRPGRIRKIKGTGLERD